MSGKAVSHAMRGHDLVDQALNILFTAVSYDMETDELPHVEKYSSAFKQVGDLRRGFLLDNTHNIADANTSEALHRILEKQNRKRLQLENNRTAALWFQYMEMVTILKCFIRAERTGNWHQYLKTLNGMLPYFAAAGHTHFTKSVCVHVENMLDLQTLNPDLYTKFENSLFIIRRSDREWAGLTPELVIEQALVRSLKTTGGLTRGRSSTRENVDSVKEVGLPIINDITGKAADTYTFRKKDKAVNMTSKAAVEIDRDTVSTAIWEIAKPEEVLQCIPSHSIYTIEGGWLLQQIPWQLGTTYDTICDSYVEYVIKHFGKAFIALMVTATDLPRKISLTYRGRRVVNAHKSLGVYDSILFIHAFLGCGTTSIIFGVEKHVGLLLALSDEQLQKASLEFCKPGASKEDVIASGVQALVRVYRGRIGEFLPSLRLRLFMKKVASSSTLVELERIPSKRATAKFHFLRVYLQMMEWLGVSGMKPEVWGWYRPGEIYVPVMTNQTSAPPKLLSIIRWNCTTGCETARCIHVASMDCHVCSLVVYAWRIVVPTMILWKFWKT
ncbi:hypothetical protein PR048_029644 [Dryococelus australis]|uniref:Uncharacterized protein n=1 Tax=Dryococelus australis TaxID=614101 RepID=A0ABQ9GDZ9_9NEOP|nr:hypothetical protein PR048_029644 [Dryococelus australis]